MFRKHFGFDLKNKSCEVFCIKLCNSHFYIKEIYKYRNRVKNDTALYEIEFRNKKAKQQILVTW